MSRIISSLLVLAYIIICVVSRVGAKHSSIPKNAPSLFIIIIIVIIIIIIIEVTHSKTVLENTVEIEPQPVALDLKNLSQYSSRSK